MYIGNLSNVVFDEDYRNDINQFLHEDYFLIEADSPQVEDRKADNIIDYIKKNCWHKPREWLSMMLQKLNYFLCKIASKKKRADGSELNLWDKIKKKIARAITMITVRMERFVRPDNIDNVIPKKK